MELPKVKSFADLNESLTETLIEVNRGTTQFISHHSGNVVMISESNYQGLITEIRNLKDILQGLAELENNHGIEHEEALKINIKEMTKFGSN